MFLERPGLDASIRRGLEAGAVVLQAPPGFGKTVALRSALRDCAMPVAWYDTAPWDEASFANALMAATARVRNEFGRDTRALAQAGASPQALARAFGGDVARVPSPFVLAIDDDAGLLDTPAFAAFVDELLAIRPNQLHLAIATRTVRPRDAAATIEADELRFTPDEIATTRAWPAPGARALDHFDDDARLLAQSLAVAATIDPQQFDRATRATLKRLHAGGLLLQTGAGTFELEPLVRSSLIDAMRDRDDGSLQAAHATAAARAERNGAFGEALYHLDAAREPAPLLAFLHRHLELVELAGALPQMLRSVERLRSEGHDDPALFAYADALNEQAGGGERAGELFERAALAATKREQPMIAFSAGARAAEFALAHGRSAGAQRTASLVHLGDSLGEAARQTAGVLQAWQHAVDGDFEGAIAVAGRFEERAEGRAASGLTIVLAYAETSLGRIGSARRRLDALIARLEGSDSVVLYVQASIWYARLALLWGDTGAALDYAQQAQRVAARLDLETEAASLYAALTEASAHAGDAPATLRWAQELRRHAQTAWYGVDRLRLGAIADQHVARALFLRGDTTDAIALARDAAVQAPAVQRCVLLADAVAFATAAGTAPPPTARPTNLPLPGDAADAVALGTAYGLLDALGVLPDDGAPSAYAALLRERDGSVRLPLVGATLRNVLLGTQSRDALLGALDLYCERGPRFERAVLERLASRKSLDASAKAPPALQEPLTEREAEVLAQLAAGLTNKEIAERLIVSPRTVETHVERVLGKLGVGSRTRAIAKAIRLRLVSVDDLE